MQTSTGDEVHGNLILNVLNRLSGGGIALRSSWVALKIKNQDYLVLTTWEDQVSSKQVKHNLCKLQICFWQYLRRVPKVCTTGDSDGNNILGRCGG